MERLQILMKLTAKRSGKFAQQVLLRDQGICQLCGLDCVEFEQLIEDWQGINRYNEVRPILEQHGLPSPPIGYRCYQIDHVQPIARGGKDCLENLRVLCLVCHRQVTTDLQGQLSRIPEKIIRLEVNKGNQ